jgi:hypothetical protein
MHDLLITNSLLPLFALDDVDVVTIAVGIGVDGDYLGAHFGRVFAFVVFFDAFRNGEEEGVGVQIRRR